MVRLFRGFVCAAVLLVGCPEDPPQDDDTTAGDDDSGDDDDSADDDDDDDDDDDPIDADGDGFDETVDCDDLDPQVNPDAQEVDCDGVDNDCDGLQATEHWVPAAEPTVQAAIEVSTDGDAVCVEPGTYTENISFLGRAIHVLGVDGPTTTVLVGGGSDCVVSFQNGEGLGSVLEGFTVTGGGDSGIRVDLGGPTLVNLVVSGNEGFYGGGIRCWYSDPLVRDVLVDGNTALLDGGGIALDGSHAILEDVAVIGNIATHGGGLSVWGSSSLQMSGGVVSWNTTDHWQQNGGGLDVEESVVSLSSVELIGNEAGMLGGGLYANESTIVMDGVAVRDGSAGIGGGLYIQSSQVTIMSSVISGNTAAGDHNPSGGGLLVEWTTAELTDVVVSDNHADEGSGGGIKAYGDSFVANRVTISGNSASSAAGAYLSADQNTLTHVVIAGNTASQRTGGLGWYGNGTLTNVVVAGNSAGTDAGGIRSSGAPGDNSILLSHVAVVGNSAVENGGGLYLDGTSATFDGIEVSGNTAGLEGGGFWVEDPQTLSLSHSNAWDNTPQNYLADLDPAWDPTGVAGNLSADPLYLDLTDPDPSLWDLHLDVVSTLIDAGDPSLLDPDASTCDIGAYGGAGAGLWDRDQDSYPEWWQPGPYDPVNYPADGWDCDDHDPAVHPGNGC